MTCALQTRRPPWPGPFTSRRLSEARCTPRTRTQTGANGRKKRKTCNLPDPAGSVVSSFRSTTEGKWHARGRRFEPDRLHFGDTLRSGTLTSNCLPTGCFLRTGLPPGFASRPERSGAMASWHGAGASCALRHVQVRRRDMHESRARRNGFPGTASELGLKQSGGGSGARRSSVEAWACSPRGEQVEKIVYVHDTVAVDIRRTGRRKLHQQDRSIIGVHGLR